MEHEKLLDILDRVKGVVISSKLAPSATESSDMYDNIIPPNVPPLPQSLLALPESQSAVNTVMSSLTAHVLPYLNKSSLSPRYYGFVTGGATPAALTAEILASIYDQNVQVHLPREYIATQVEVAALNMLVDLFNLPKADWMIGTNGNGGGNFTTGATASNIQGLALGREFVLGRAAEENTGKWMSVGEHGLIKVANAAGVERLHVLSTLPHSSIAKSASVVGLGRSSIISIAKNNDPLDIDVEKLRSLAELSKKDRIRYIVAISAGEVNTGRFATGSLSWIQDIRNICDEYGIWIHVDGAFGLFARVLTESSSTNEYKAILDGVQGIELADSITGDGHKMLNVPYDCGFFFTRHKQLSEQVFMNGNAAYLTSGTGSDAIQSPLNIGIENSRRFRALPVYTTLLAYGRQGYVEMILRQMTLARRIASWLWDHNGYELLPSSNSKEHTIQKTFIIVLFRAKDDFINNNLVSKINHTGKIYVSGTKWEGHPAVRLAISNWRVDPQRDGTIIEHVLSQALAVA